MLVNCSGSTDPRVTEFCICRSSWYFELSTAHQYAAMAPCLQDMMDAVKGAGWTRFQSVEGQPIPEKDMRSVFKLVDLDKDGTISGMVQSKLSWRPLFIYCFQELKMSLKYLGKRYKVSNVRLSWRFKCADFIDITSDGAVERGHASSGC